MSSSKFEKIDSHIHLYAAKHISSLAWAGDLPPDHPLNRQNSVDEYRASNSSPSNLKGFVFLETDRKSSLRPEDWKDPLQEVSFLDRIASDLPEPGDGHAIGDAALVRGIVAWAPVPSGTEGLEAYMERLRRACGPATLKKLKGVRYLLQDKDVEIMRNAKTIEGLQWLGKKCLTFDLGVDARSGGMHQLQEAVKMLRRVYQEGEPGPKVIINHMCKPNMRLVPETLHGNIDFEDWKTCILEMARFPQTYMKLSGGFSELPPQEIGDPSPPKTLLPRIMPWAQVIFEAFGPRRTMFGSDWPVCNVGGGGSELAWKNWEALVGLILKEQGFGEDETAMVWAKTAREAYGLD
ncbi:MAG: hypothetical protein Q9160_004147 [Pyrenula sp. 1 TL-2023]